MSEKRRSGYCRECDKQVVAFKPGTNHILHLILSLITGGLWLPVWLILVLTRGGWRCEQCGRKGVNAVR